MVDEHYHTVLLVYQRITTSTLQLLQNSKYTCIYLILGFLAEINLLRTLSNLPSVILRDKSTTHS